jgi:hypothetical protein
MAAIKVMTKMIRRGIVFEKLGFYKCSECGFYHLSTKELKV